MVAIIDRITKFFQYWWLRYLTATELYIVEPWERVLFREYKTENICHSNIVFNLFFFFRSYFSRNVFDILVL